jgi:hypothetical protein
VSFDRVRFFAASESRRKGSQRSTGNKEKDKEKEKDTKERKDSVTANTNTNTLKEKDSNNAFSQLLNGTNQMNSIGLGGLGGGGGSRSFTQRNSFNNSRRSFSANALPVRCNCIKRVIFLSVKRVFHLIIDEDREGDLSFNFEAVIAGNENEAKRCLEECLGLRCNHGFQPVMVFFNINAGEEAVVKKIAWGLKSKAQSLNQLRSLWMYAVADKEIAKTIDWIDRIFRGVFDAPLKRKILDEQYGQSNGNNALSKAIEFNN